MELAITEAKGRLSELVAAAQNGERIVITKHGEPAAELIGCGTRRHRGIDWEKLDASRRRLGIGTPTPEEDAAWKATFEDSALSRRVLGLEEQ